MKRFFAVLLCLILFFCGCSSAEPLDISLTQSFETSLSATFKGVSIKADMLRGMPQIYTFSMKEGSFEGAVIDIRSDVFSLSYDELKYEGGTLPKTSFFFMVTSVLDYLSSPDLSVEYGELKDNILYISGNNGYEDFEMQYDVTTNLPERLKIPSVELEVYFQYS